MVRRAPRPALTRSPAYRVLVPVVLVLLAVIAAAVLILTGGVLLGVGPGKGGGLMRTLLPAITSLVVLAFTTAVFARYRRRGGTHLLIWGIGLVMFAVVSLAETYATVAWHPLVFKLWYLCGAILTAAWLGQGTVFLLSKRKNLARLLLGLLVAASVLALYLVLKTPLNGDRFRSSQPLSAQYGEILSAGAAVRKLTPFFNTYGTVTLVGGALYSAWLMYRKEVVPRRVIGNLLIAAGGVSLAFASVWLRYGLGDYLSMAELLAAVAMFAGFVLATASPAQERPMPEVTAR